MTSAREREGVPEGADQRLARFLRAALTFLPDGVEPIVARGAGVSPDRLTALMDGSLCATRADVLGVFGALRGVTMEILQHIHGLPEAVQAGLRLQVLAMLPLAEVLDRVQEIADRKEEQAAARERVN